MSTGAAFVTSAWSCTVRLVVDDSRALVPAAADLTTLLDQVDTAASRFRADSVLSRANARAGRPVPIPQLLVELVGAALDAAAATGGLVDPTLGLTLSELGYDRDISDVQGRDLPPRQADLNLLRPRRADTRAPGRISNGRWREVRLDRDAGLLTVPAGTCLDLGATAKPYLADRAARTLANRYGTATLVELGGDLAVAGERETGWCIAVAERAGDPAQAVTIRGGGLATSTTTIRRWRREGVQLHHIIDPRTGQPAADVWRTVTVHADSALSANTASTAAIVLGELAPDWLDARGLAARLIRHDGLLTTTGGWPVDDLAVSEAAA